MPYKLTFFLLGIIFLSSCLEEPPCSSVPEKEGMKVQFKSLIDSTDLFVKIDSVHSLQYLGNYIQNDSLDVIYLPFSPYEQQLDFVFHTEYGKDTMLISYSTLPKLYATYCDVSVVYDQFKVDSFTFDSLYFDNTQLPVYVEVYY